MKNIFLAFSLLSSIGLYANAKVSSVAGKASPGQIVLDFGVEACRGNIPGVRCEHKFGINPSIGTATTPEDVWQGGGLWVRPTTGTIHHVRSDDTGDDSASTGCRTIELFGVDNDWSAESEIITMDGTTVVATTNTWAVIHRAICRTFGSGSTNAGDINIVSLTDGTTTAVVISSHGQTGMAILAVPRNSDFFMTLLWASINKSGGVGSLADVELLVEPMANGTSGFNVKKFFDAATDGTSVPIYNITPPFPISGNSVIVIRVDGVSANSTSISAGFDGYIIER